METATAVLESIGETEAGCSGVHAHVVRVCKFSTEEVYLFLL